MKLKDFLEAIQETIKDIPDSDSLEVVYSSDDEENEYLKVNFTPILCKMKNINEDRWLETTFPEKVFVTREDVNAIIIN